AKKSYNSIYIASSFKDL
ncbi:unnamed protein product, partial [Fusarium fujikuroi]